MIITRKSLPRRSFLRGAGASLALPLLDSMVPALSAKAREPVRRLGWVYVPNGMVMGDWTPPEGEELEITPILSPLEDYRDRMVVPIGLAHPQAEPLGDGNGEHTRASATWLNGVHPRQTEGADVQAGVTADQIAARQLGKTTPLPSLELSLDGANYEVGNCENGYSCVYLDTISWRNATTPQPMEANPRVVFERLFGDGGSPAERRAQFEKDRSILDAIGDDIARLRRDVGRSDQARVEQYLDAVRAIERRIELSAESEVELPELERPAGIPEAFGDHVDIMLELAALAYQADVTRVFTFMMGRELNDRAYPELGVPDAHHSMSHHRNDPQKLEKLSKINLYHAQLFKKFVDRLAATEDGDGSLLDHSLILYGAGLSDSNKHSHYDLPLALIGGSGYLKGGRRLSYPRYTPMTNLLLSMLDKAGVRLEEALGDSTGRLSELAPLTDV